MVTVEEHSSEIEEHRELGEKSAIRDAKEGSMDDKGVKLKFMDQWIAAANSCPASGHESPVSSPGKIRKAREITPAEKAVLLLWFLTVLAVCVYTLVHLLC